MDPKTASTDPYLELTSKYSQMLAQNSYFGRVMGRAVSKGGRGQCQISRVSRPPRRGKLRPPQRSVILRSIDGADKDVDAYLDNLSKVFEAIYAGESSPTSFECSYRNTYQIVLKKRGDTLYDMFHQFNDHWLRKNFLGRFGDLASNLSACSLLPPAINIHTFLDERKAVEDELLVVFRDTWENYCRYVSMCSDVLGYLDRVYCGDNRKVGIYISCMTSLRDHVIRSNLPGQATGSTVSGLVTTAILDQIKMSRLGSKVDHNSIRSCIFALENIFECYGQNETIEFWDHPKTDIASHSTELSHYEKPFDSSGLANLYNTQFEPQFLQEGREFYGTEGLNLAANT